MKIRMAALALVALASQAGAAVSVYGHAPIIEPFSFGGTSSFYTQTSDRHVAEGFTLDASADLSAVRFWGGMVGSAPVQPGAFRIIIWTSDGVSDNGIAGSPGTVYFSQETLVTDARFTQQTESAVQPLLQRYDIDLGITLRLNAGERYWISIEGRSEPGQSFSWAWADSLTNGGAWSGYDIFSSDSWFTIAPTLNPRGTAFELFAIPSPAVTSLLAFAAVAVRRRR